MENSSKLFIALAAMVSLAGCSAISSGTGTSGTINPDQVVTDAENICKFVPAAETVIGIIGAGVPGLSTAGAIAKAICDSLPQKGAAALPKTPPTVAGIPIRGRYLK